MPNQPTATLEFTIDAELKRQGDEILVAHGVTPDEAVTLLYQAIVRLKDIPWGLQDQED